MKIEKIKKNSGFVILFAVTVSSILLAIALGVSNIALKEVKFSTNARNTNDAFFAADTGIEYTLFHDKTSSGDYPAPAPGNSESWSFTILNLGSTGLACTNVNITKDNTVAPMTTTIISKGYNIGDPSCNWEGTDRIERELKITY